MRRDFFQVHNRRFDELLIDQSAVPVLRNIALSLRQSFEKTGFHRPLKQRVGQLHGSARIFDDLHRLNSRKFIKEPAAARVHQHGIALHLEKLQRGDLLRFAQLPDGMLLEEAPQALLGAVENHVNVSISRRPRIL